MYRVLVTTGCFLGLAFLMLLSPAVSSSAEQASVLQRGEFPTWKFKIGGDDRVRYEYRDDFNFRDTKPTKGSRGYGTGSLFFNRFKVNGQALLSDEYLNKIAEVFVEGLDARVGSYQMSRPVQKDSFDLHQAYLNLYNMFGSDFDLKAGRQEMKYGAGRLISNPTWANLIRSFDAAILRYRPEGFYADILYGHNVVFHPKLFDTMQYKEKIAGIYAGYQKDKASTLIEGYFLPLLTHNNTTKASRYTAGLRLQGRIPAEIMYDIEFPYQFGTTNNRTIRAYAFHIDLSRQFWSALWQPKVTLAYDEASGDRNARDGESNTFIPLYQSTHDPYGLMDFFRWQNMRNLELGTTLYLTEKLKLIPQVDFFWLMTTNDSWYDSGGTAVRSMPTKGLIKHYVGEEISLRASYDFNKNTKFELGAAHFFTGKYVQASGPNEDVNWVYSQLSLKF